MRLTFLALVSLIIDTQFHHHSGCHDLIPTESRVYWSALFRFISLKNLFFFSSWKDQRCLSLATVCSSHGQHTEAYGVCCGPYETSKLIVAQETC